MQDRRAGNADYRSALPSPPPRLYEHPAMAVSLILIVASLAQIGVWLINRRPPATAPLAVQSSSVTVHGLLFAKLTGEKGAAQPVVFVVCLLTALLSGPAWYGAVRVALGPVWALWTGLFWAAHPAFAFLAQRAAALTLLIALVPMVWWLLVWWKRSGRQVAALLAGAVLGLISLVSIQGLLLLGVALPAILLAGGPAGKRWLGALVLFATYLALVAVWFTRYTDAADRLDIKQRVVVDLWNAFAGRDGSALARAAHGVRSEYPPDHPPSPVRFFVSQLDDSPRSTVLWLVRRFWRSLYATHDGGLQRSLFVLQLLWLVPAIWGYVVALRCGPWRWMGLTAGGLVAVPWLLAALAEPLSRNLAPVGGFAIMFGLIGVVDVYERILGRRLTATVDSAGGAGARHP